MPEEITSTASAKAEFSGPADLIAIAHKAADPKGHFEGEKWIVGERGAWSSWLCAAVEEKLKRDGQWPAAESELKTELVALAEEVGLVAAIEALRGKLRRTGAKGKVAA